MSEQPPPEQPKEIEADRLKVQARNLRRAMSKPRVRGDQYSLPQKLLVTLVLAFSLGGATFALLDPGSRQRLIARAGDEWAKRFAADRESGIFKLPPPPPRPVDTKVVVPPVFVGAESPSGVIYGVGESPEEPLEKTYVPPPKTAEAAGAFNLLRAKSAVAGKLVAGELEGFQFKEWKPVQSKPPVHFVDLVATRLADSSEVHLVWSVDLQTEKVSPLSQLARDLESRP